MKGVDTELLKIISFLFFSRRQFPVLKFELRNKSKKKSGSLNSCINELIKAKAWRACSLRGFKGVTPHTRMLHMDTCAHVRRHIRKGDGNRIDSNE